MASLFRNLTACALFIAGFLVASPLHAAELSREEAESLLWDTFTIAAYTGLNGESDYAGKPENIICAALFGAFNAKMEWDFQQEYRAQNGGSPQPDDMPLFTVCGKPLMPEGVHTREDYPSFFRNVPETFTAFVSREAAELSALHFTGPLLSEHRLPPAGSMLGETKLTAKGYFISVEGLGDVPIGVDPKMFSHEGNSWVLMGELVDLNAEDDAPLPRFRLKLYPGEVPGAWKRQYEEYPGK